MAISVGLLTMHRVHNCGSLLQAYATQVAIERLGYKCEVIDYVYPNDFHYSRSDWSRVWAADYSLKKMMKCLVKRRFVDFLHYWDFYTFDKCMHKLLHLSYRTYYTFDDLCKMKKKYDVLCLGSDQTLNPRFTLGDKAFVLGFDDVTPKISYASSITTTKLSEDIVHLYQEYLPKFNAFSVRENNSVELFNKILGVTPVAVVDPVFLLSARDWCKKFHICLKRRNYIFVMVYNYMNDVTNLVQNKIFEKFNESQFEVYSTIDLPENVTHKMIRNLLPAKFISLIANASLVITDSFHATAFSLIFKTPCLSITGNMAEDKRIANLIETNFHSEAYSIQQYDGGKICLYEIPEYSGESKMENSISYSMNYLRNCLSFCEKNLN